MICVICGHDNLEGLDSCENCGGDLRTVDIPVPENPFEARMQAPLSTLRPRSSEIVSPQTPVAEAVGAMRSTPVDCLLVGDGGRLVGIFTERDAVVKLAGTSLEGVTVADVMTEDPVVLRADDTIAVAIHKMAVGGFRHIPLVDEAGSPSAVVSAVDVFRHVLTLR